MKNAMARRAGSKGFSLIELLLVIGFIAGALVLAFVTYPKVQSTNRANVESQHLTIISGGIKNLYSTARDFSTLTNQVLINSRVVPDDMSALAAAPWTINNVWSGTVEVLPSAGSPLRYQITYTAVPAAECVKLATGVSTNFLQLSIGGTVVFDRIATGGTVNIDPAALTASCNNPTNVMLFVGN